MQNVHICKMHMYSSCINSMLSLGNQLSGHIVGIIIPSPLSVRRTIISFCWLHENQALRETLTLFQEEFDEICYSVVV